MKIGTLEFIVILLVAFFVLGPEKTVVYARKLGKGLRTLKIYVNSFTDDIRETVVEPLSEIQEPLNELQKPFEALQKPLEEARQSFREPVNELNGALADSKASLSGAGIAAAVQERGAKAEPPDKTAEAAPAECVEEELEEAVPLEELPEAPEAAPAEETTQSA